MNINFRLLLILMSGAVVLGGCAQERYVTVQGFAQGSTYHVIYKMPENGSEKTVAAGINNILSAIDNSLSGYNKGSILSQVNGGQDVALDNYFVECFQRSKEIWIESNGAFDPSAAPLFDLWGFGFEDGSTPSQEAIDSILQFVGMDKVEIEKRDEEYHLKKSDPRIKLNFNAIAQGFTCDAIASYLKDEGCGDYLVEVGREIVCSGLNAKGGKWRIGLDKPIDGNFNEGENLQTILEVTDCGIVTSGNYRKFYIKDGQKFAHTIDPRTGRPVQHNLLSSTIITKDATTADAYATWSMVIGVEASRESIATKENLSAYLVYEADGEITFWSTSI